MSAQSAIKPWCQGQTQTSALKWTDKNGFWFAIVSTKDQRTETIREGRQTDDFVKRQLGHECNDTYHKGS